MPGYRQRWSRCVPHSATVLLHQMTNGTGIFSQRPPRSMEIGRWRGEWGVKVDNEIGIHYYYPRPNSPSHQRVLKWIETHPQNAPVRYGLLKHRREVVLNGNL